MIVHPEIAALRGNDASQRLAQDRLRAEMTAWRDSAAVAAIQADLAAFATARPMAECPALSALFEEGNPAARRLAESFAATSVGAIARAPLAQMPLRNSVSDAVSTLLIGRAGPVSLLLVAIDGTGMARRPAPSSVSFSASTCWEHILAGAAQGELIAMRPAGPDRAEFQRKSIALTAGSVLSREGSRQALVLGRVAGCLVSLRMIRRHEPSAPSREYDLASGRMIHQSAGSPRESRQELMVNLLGRMGRTDAAPLLAAMACESGGASLRWEALRECLSLDTAAGFAALSRLAVDPADALQSSAAALRARLIETHPELRELEPCPA